MFRALIFKLAGKRFIQVGTRTQMAQLKKLELFREKRYSDRDASWPSIEGNLNWLDDQQKQAVLAHMKRSTTLIEFVSPSVDPHFAKDSVRNAIFSDGEYVWDGVVLNWVEKYGVKLPISFLEHVEAYKNKGTGNLNVGELLEASKTAELILVD